MTEKASAEPEAPAWPYTIWSTCNPTARCLIKILTPVMDARQGTFARLPARASIYRPPLSREKQAIQIELARTVAAPPAAAFTVAADILHWPEVIDSIRSIEVLTPGPIRVGSRLREVRIMFGHMATQKLEVAALERPHRVRLFADHPDLHYELDHVIDAMHGGGSRIMLIFRSRPASAAGRVLQPLMSPFMEITLRDELEQDLSDLATAASERDTH